ncbi:MAG: GspH/FimT family pseudopilin [Thiothrix sp.]
MQTMQGRQTGVTLVELTVTLAVVAVLAAFAAPSIKAILESNRLTALNNQLVSSLNYARSEAVKRNYPVTMCVRNSAGTGCATSGGFENGWIIFVDCNGNNVVNTSGCDFGAGNANVAEPILQDVTPNANGITVTGQGSASPVVRYRPNGGIAGVSSSLTLNSTGEAEQTLNMGATPRQKIKIQGNTGRIRSCKIPADATDC